MSLTLHWQILGEGRERTVDIHTDFAVLRVVLYGEVIQHTEWLLQQNEIGKGTSALIRSLKHYLENPVDADLSLALKQQGSQFRRRVWRELSRIPFGETITYSQLAERLSSGARAVANACRDNPYPGIIPCHRVVSAHGIGGFMGQTHGVCIELKRRILEYEYANRQ